MFRDISPSIAQHPSVRRRLRDRQGADIRSRQASLTVDLEEWDSNLDLSMHHNRAPFSNRFEAFAAPSPAITRERVIHVPSSKHRSRNSRATKEAKRRRDAKRNGRKVAAQCLDEQLSRRIDETLTKANIDQTKPINAPKAPALLATSISKQSSETTLSRFTRTPQLPPIDFGSADLLNFPYLSMSKHSPLLPPRRSVSTKVPSWCPQISPCIQDVVGTDSSPTFWDLSKLPESTTHIQEPLQDLRLGKRPMEVQPKKRPRLCSAFRTSEQVVKLAPTGCGLHSSKEVGQDPVTTAWNAFIEPTNLQPAMTTVEKIIAAVEAETRELNWNQRPHFTTKLWHILASAMDDSREAIGGSHETFNWVDRVDDANDVPLAPSCNHESSPAVELGDTQMPYVHGNSLPGLSNDVGTYHANRNANESLLPDFAIYLADILCPAPLIDDTSPPYELAAMSWPPTPPTATPYPAYDSVTAPSINSYVETTTSIGSSNLTGSVDHCNSERHHDPAEVPLPKSPSESQCDLNMFLSMDDVESCWCCDCDEPPEIVDADDPEVIDQAELTTPLTEDDDGWMVWSSIGNTVGTNTTMQSPILKCTKQIGEQNTSSSTPHTLDRDTSISSTPACPLEDLLSHEEAFLGYYDDGYAFAREEADYDWLWSL